MESNNWYKPLPTIYHLNKSLIFSRDYALFWHSVAQKGWKCKDLLWIVFGWIIYFAWHRGGQWNYVKRIIIFYRVILYIVVLSDVAKIIQNIFLIQNVADNDRNKKDGIIFSAVKLGLYFWQLSSVFVYLFTQNRHLKKR